nr:MAG: putative RNA-dependent RNA polymerase [Narnaviridae sp.]UJQ92817.1 MAG: putative RNA-dependent RNA polymerase [Narnaviridae sp.]
MNQFLLIRSIDDILSRLHAVRPVWSKRHDGPTQWLFIHEPGTSSFDELELVRATTELSAPTFLPSEERDPGGLYMTLDGSAIVGTPPPRLASGSLLPSLQRGQTHYSVDYRLIQAFSGLRSVLLVLIDSCGLCASTPDFIGIQPYTDSLSVLRHMSKWSELDFVPNAKFWKDRPMARFLRNESPPVPSSWTLSPSAALFSGETGRYYSRLATYDDKRPDSFSFFRAVFGLAQSKRGFAQVPQCFVRKAMQKHAQQLSTPPSSEPDLGALKVFVKTMFSGFRCPRIFASLPKQEGSMNASVENSRQNGGAREHLRYLARKFHGTERQDPVAVLGRLPTTPLDPELLREFQEALDSLTPTSELFSNLSPPSLASRPSGDFVTFHQPNAFQVIEERGEVPLTAEDWKSLARTYDSSQSRRYLSPTAQGGLADLAKKFPESKELPVARVAEVLEPLKVRLITAMDAVRSHVARPLQRALWRHLRTFPMFRLVGETVSEDVIYDLCAQHAANGGGEDPFVSGDYSAATDGLDIRVSKVVLEEILNSLQPDDVEFRDYISSILYEQVIIYPSWTKIQPVVQRNGQLMGSVLSFIVLCVANAFAYTQSLPRSQEIIRSLKLIRELAVRINGDDILFRSSDEHYRVWSNEIEKVGFVKSVGKNFRHARFMTINSVPIEYKPARTSVDFWSTFSNWADMEEVTIPWDLTSVPEISLRGYLNVGLLTGQAKLTGRAALGALPLSGWHAGAVLEALNPAQAHNWFLKYHADSILRQTRYGPLHLNLFAHPLLGGLGFVVPSGVTPRYSPEQRRLAQALFLSASYTYEGQESEFSLDSLLLLESETVGPQSTLGNIRRRVVVELYPFGTPLPEGYEPFVDQSGIQPIAMVHGVPEVDPESFQGMRPKCRLSSGTLRRLSSRHYGTADLYPLDKMTSFPFVPVKRLKQMSDFIPVTGKNPNDATQFVERPFSLVYAPDVPHQDVAVPPTEPVLAAPSEPESWENLETTLRISSSTPDPPALSSIRFHATEVQRRRLAERIRRAQTLGRHLRLTDNDRKILDSQ